MPSQSKRSYVYFVQCQVNGLIKIGITDTHPDGRLASLRIGSPVPLEPLGIIRGTLRVEKFLHIRFGKDRAHGEWFRPSQELLHFIKVAVQPWPKPKEPPTDKDKPEFWERWLDRELAKMAEDEFHRRRIERTLGWDWMNNRGEVVGLA